MKEKMRRWIYNIVADALSNWRQTDRTPDVVRLMLDLHEGEWSIQSDRFLRELNINPQDYKSFWTKYYLKRR